MIASVHITEKSFGDKNLMKDVKFSIEAKEKTGVVGRNGVGKSTLFGILAGQDSDFIGDVIYQRGISVVSTAQEHRENMDMTVMDYVLAGLPEYDSLKRILDEYPETMGDNMKKISEYTDALNRFNDKGFYQIQDQIKRELANFQLANTEESLMRTLSGGQKRLVEIVKIIHANAHLALIDEPTNHMDYVAKQRFIDWLETTEQSVLVITHDRDVLAVVDRIIELKDNKSCSHKGNYDHYLRRNIEVMTTGMNNFEQIKKRMANLQQKIVDYKRLKEKSRDGGTIQKFKRLENMARAELAELSDEDKPTFWIDKESIDKLNYKDVERYGKLKTKNIRLDIKKSESRSKNILAKAENLAIGYGDNILFEGINFELKEGEKIELRGRNGAGKTTLIKALLSDVKPVIYSGEIVLAPNVRIGIYEQEINHRYMDDNLEAAIENMYMARKLPITKTKIRQLCADYLFTDDDRITPLSKLSGGQKARFQLIAMLANEPQLLILDEPTNHLDLPSIEELELALQNYTGAILYVSHDNYFRRKIGGEIIQIGL